MSIWQQQCFYWSAHLPTQLALQDEGSGQINLFPWHRNKHGLFLSQAKYITDLLLKSDMIGCKPIGSPASKAKLSPSNGSPLDEPSIYRSIVGALQYESPGSEP